VKVVQPYHTQATSLWLQSSIPQFPSLFPSSHKYLLSNYPPKTDIFKKPVLTELYLSQNSMLKFKFRTDMVVTGMHLNIEKYIHWKMKSDFFLTQNKSDLAG